MQLPVHQHDSGSAASSWPQALPRARVAGLYVHVPFCFHKCHYCDFYSITRQTPQRMESFVDRVLREADAWASGERGPRVRAGTVFVGGGTPSLLPLEAMRRMLRGLAERFDLGSVEEWTAEVNPATVSGEYCAMLREAGVNRISLGAQSFAEPELKVLERQHVPADVERTVELARGAGFGRLNVDLIYAIPGQSLESWMQSLSRAMELGTEHLSCYALTYEANTPMAVKKRLGTIRAAEEELELRMLHATRAHLAAAGYEAYEISNYARPGEACRHNLMYWNGGSYIGLGPSAASHVEGWRWKNRAHLGEWEQAIDAGTLPATDVEQLTPQQRAGELAMLQLRLKEGVRFEKFRQLTGYDARETYRETLSQLAKAGLIHIDAGGFGLTETGINVADAVAGEFLAL